jgi:hypothetical protein
MLKEPKREPFGCLKSFSHLNGREKQYVIVGDNPDARIAKLWFLERILHNWPSQWHSRYKGGYIEFENWNKFDLKNQTVGGKPSFLFLVTPEIYILWRRQTLENKIKDSVNDMAQNDMFAAAQIIQSLADLIAFNQSLGQSSFLALLPALSVSQLEDLAELFDMPWDKQNGTASPAET